MQSKLKIALALAAGSALLLAAAVPVMAQSNGFIYQGGPGWSGSGYRDSNGNYRSLADYTRDVEGTPCGINCTRAAQGQTAREYFGRVEQR